MLLRKRWLFLWVHGQLGTLIEKPLPEKEEFHSSLNVEDIIDTDYMHGKRVCKDFEIKKLVYYIDLYFS